MTHNFSFCNLCEMYHIDWDKSDVKKIYETHLTPKEKLEAQSFDQYLVKVNNLPNCMMYCYSPSLANKLKENMKAFYDPK